MTRIILETDKLSVKFGGLIALNDFNLQMREGVLMGLIGPNGAGKTTAFNLITGGLHPTSGVVRFMNEDISGLKPDRVNNRGIARTFQNIRLFKEMTVLENVMLAYHGRIRSSFIGAAFRLGTYLREEKNMEEGGMDLLRRLELDKQSNDTAGSLPYGRQRKLEIARALATSPKLLLLDEPAAGMNPRETNELMDFIVHIREDFGLTVLLIEHDMKVIMGISEEIIVLDHGESIARGKPEEIQNHPDVIRAYLGEKLDDFFTIKRNFEKRNTGEQGKIYLMFEKVPIRQSL